MNPIMLTCAAICINLHVAQFPQAPTELKHLAFMIGEWKAKVTLHVPGLEPVTCDSTVERDSLFNGMFHKTLYVMEGVPGFGKVEGTMFTTYDSTQKTFRSWSFDNTAPLCFESTGTWDGKKLVMTSKPVDMGMGPMTFRWTFEKVSDTEIKFLMELKSNADFQKVVEGIYTKKTV